MPQLGKTTLHSNTYSTLLVCATSSGRLSASDKLHAWAPQAQQNSSMPLISIELKNAALLQSPRHGLLGLRSNVGIVQVVVPSRPHP